MQVKLLRALQEHEIRRIGENTNRKVDVRMNRVCRFSNDTISKASSHGWI
jgi:transcriptional regulator with PAS, ATPase and Fis domain